MFATTQGFGATASRTARVFLAVLSVLVSVLAIASPVASAKPEEPKKVFVCKYVGTPGVNERLQAGGNPINVSVNAIPGFVSLETVVGMEFGDLHGQSIVIAVDVGQPDPPRTACPPARAPDVPVQLTPSLVVDKVASTETITITGPAGALVATPSVVTWTLTYTLTNGPVNGVVITDPVPAGFTFLDASNGGTLVSGTVTWNLGSLSASGSVTFRTTVVPATVARGLVTNTATIDSTQTAPDTGQDTVTVSQTSTLSGNPTPAPTPGTLRTGTLSTATVPNTAASADAGMTAAAMLGALMLLSAGAFVSATIGSGRRRR